MTESMHSLRYILKEAMFNSSLGNTVDTAVIHKHKVESVYELQKKMHMVLPGLNFQSHIDIMTHKTALERRK